MMALRFYARAGWWTVFLGTIGLSLLGCAGGDSARPAAAPPRIARINSPPEWRPGDRWVYDWKLGAQTGTKTVEVLEIREVNGVPYYVVGIGDIKHYYTLDLRWAGAVRESRVEARMEPPKPWFVWPLQVGDRWVHRGVFEERDETKEQDDTFAVVTAGTVEVPAGRFTTLKVVREATGSRDSDQYWYAPEVRWYVRWIGRRGDDQFEERLRGYHPAPRLIPESAPAIPPTQTR